jgi:hypothetical protein
MSGRPQAPAYDPATELAHGYTQAFLDYWWAIPIAVAVLVYGGYRLVDWSVRTKQDVDWPFDHD